MPGADRTRTVRDALAAGTTYSFEFFPPRDDVSEAALWDALRQLEKLHPSFVSVTYGAGGTTRKLTHEAVTTIGAHTGLNVAAHLTCVDATREETLAVVQSYADAGITEVVALRAIDSVLVTRSVSHPESFPDGGAEVVETWLTLVWGGNRRIDIGPAACEDPDCEADHGYTGVDASNDLTIRMSPAGDGEQSTRKLLEFGALLQRRIGR